MPIRSITRLFTLFLVSLFVHQAKAAFLTLIPNGKTAINPTQRTHLIVSGRGSDLGELPMQAALAKGRRFAQVFPQEQVVVYAVTTPNAKGRGFNAQALARQYGYQVVEDRQDVLSGPAFLQLALQYTQIASLDFFGHSGVSAGLFLDGVGDSDSAYAWTPFMKSSASLAANFTEDAYAIFHGCNGGHLQALNMARAWRIPVAGGFTTSHFEQINTDGIYYWSNQDQSILRKNMFSLRMKSDDVVYNGYYGTYGQALSFFKFSCSKISEKKCLTGMGMSIYGVVTSVDPKQMNLEDYYAEVLKEWLCPSSYYKPGSDLMKLQANCMARLTAIQNKVQVQGLGSLNESENKLTFLRTSAIQCQNSTDESTETRCYPVDCYSSTEAMQACARKTYGSRNSTTFMDEFQNYLRALEHVRNQAPSGFLEKPFYL